MLCNDEVKSRFWQQFFVKKYKRIRRSFRKNLEHAPEKLQERVQHMENNQK